MRIELLADINSGLPNAAKQLPFVASLALNKTTIGARDLVRANLPKRFTLRNQFTQRGIQARTSTKTNLISHVLAPDYMGIQETGGERQAPAGRLLKAPTDALAGAGVIPKGKRPRALMASKGFILDMGNGDAGVFIRYGKKRGQIRLLWWLSDDQQYQPRMDFEKDVADYVQDRFAGHFLEAWDQALAKGDRYASTASRGRQRIARPEGMSARAFRRAQRRGLI